MCDSHTSTLSQSVSCGWFLTGWVTQLQSLSDDMHLQEETLDQVHMLCLITSLLPEGQIIT